MELKAIRKVIVEEMENLAAAKYAINRGNHGLAKEYLARAYDNLEALLRELSKHIN